MLILHSGGVADAGVRHVKARVFCEYCIQNVFFFKTRIIRFSASTINILPWFCTHLNWLAEYKCILILLLILHTIILCIFILNAVTEFTRNIPLFCEDAMWSLQVSKTRGAHDIEKHSHSARLRSIHFQRLGTCWCVVQPTAKQHKNRGKTQ